MSRAGTNFIIFLGNAPRAPSKSYQVCYGCCASRPKTLNLFLMLLIYMAVVFERPTLKPKAPKPAMHIYPLIYFYSHLVAGLNICSKCMILLL